MPNALTAVSRYVVSGDRRVHVSGCSLQGKQAEHYPAVDGWTKLAVVHRVTGEPWGKVCERCMFNAPDGSEQLGFGDLLEPAPTATPERLRDEGMAAADRAAPVEWRQAVDDTISRLAALGEPFTSDDVSEFTGDCPNGSQGAMGARFSAAVTRKLIRAVGKRPSKRPTVHNHKVTEWVGTP